MLGAAAGIGITVCVPTNVSPERRHLLRAYGAEVIDTDPLEGSDGAITQARALAASHPDLYWYADQYGNPANPAAHRKTTGPEIWRGTRGAVTHLVAGVGTSGTLIGAGGFLRELAPQIKLVAVEPDGPFHGLEGLKHMASALVPAIYDPKALDLTVFVATEEAEARVATLARDQGLFVGWSAGAAVAAVDQILDAEDSETADSERVIVVIAPDGGTRYLSEIRRLSEDES
jgi:cysteine synthase B